MSVRALCAGVGLCVGVRSVKTVVLCVCGAVCVFSAVCDGHEYSVCAYVGIGCVCVLVY